MKCNRSVQAICVKDFVVIFVDQLRINTFDCHRLLLACFSVLAGGLVSLSNAQVDQADIDAAITEGVRYLLSHQEDDGTWGDGERKLHTTAEVVRALSEARRLNKLPAGEGTAVNSAINSAYDAFSNSEEIDMERQALSASLRAASGRGLNTYRVFALNQQQFDGGWGITIENHSNVRDTAMVLDSLLGDFPVSVSPDRAMGAVAFLESELSIEDTGKSWSYGAGGASGVLATSRGLIAVRQLGSSLGSESAVVDVIDEALEYLLSSVDPNGDDFDLSNDPFESWITYDSESYALLLRAYAGLRQPRELDDMVQSFLNRQQIYIPSPTKGAWSSDGIIPIGGSDSVFATASVLRALLSVVQSDTDEDSEFPDISVEAFTFDGVTDLDFLYIDSFIVDTSEGGIGRDDLEDDVSVIRVQCFNDDPRIVTLGSNGLQYAQPVGGVYEILVPVNGQGIELATEVSELVPVSSLEADDDTVWIQVDFDERLTESDELNNTKYSGVGPSSQTSDIALLAGSIRVNHVDLADDPVVRLTATLINAGSMDIGAGLKARVYFRAGGVDEGYTLADINAGLEPSYLNDPLHIGYVDIDMPVNDPLEPFQGIDVSLDWLPLISSSRTVTVIVDPLLFPWDDDETNNSDEHTFEFTTGDLQMSHFVAANGDQIFDLDYGDFCYSAQHGFATYIRANSGEDWVLLGNANYGPGGTGVPCMFRLSRAQSATMASGSYQALGEVWYETGTTANRVFIDDEIIPFTIDPFTEISAVGIGFVDITTGDEIIPQGFANGISVSSLESLRVHVYYESNTEPSFTGNYKIVKVNDDIEVPLDTPVTGGLGTAVVSGSVARFNVDLSSFTLPDYELNENTSYAVVIDLDDENYPRRYVFTLQASGGYVLGRKMVGHDGDDDIIPDNQAVPAQDGVVVRVKIPITRND